MVHEMATSSTTLSDAHKVGRAARRIGGARDVLAPYLFILPFVLSFLVLFAGPALYSLALSFYRYKGYGEAKFIGLSNYLEPSTTMCSGPPSAIRCSTGWCTWCR